MTTLPKGFEEIEFEWVSSDSKHIKIMEEHVLRMLICSFRIFYSKEENDTYTSFKFYSRPQDAAQIMYHMGVYNQTMMEYYTKTKITMADHTVYEGFPECLRVEFQETAPFEPPATKFPEKGDILSSSQWKLVREAFKGTHMIKSCPLDVSTFHLNKLKDQHLKTVIMFRELMGAGFDMVELVPKPQENSSVTADERTETFFVQQ